MKKKEALTLLENSIIKGNWKKLKLSPVNKISKKIKKRILIITLTLAMIAIANFIVVSKEKKVPLPNVTQIEQSMNYFNVDNRYASHFKVHFNSDKLARMEMPKSEDSIKVIVPKNCNQKAKETIKESINEFNGIFEIINPAYKFEYSENILDGLTPSSIIVSDTLEFLKKYNLEYENYAAFQKGWTKDSSVDKNIRQKYRNFIVINQNNIDKEIFAHEMFHVLGFGDDYILEKENQFGDTIMGAVSYQRKYIRKNDLYLLASLYGNFSNEQEAALVKNKLDKYFEEIEIKRQEIEIKRQVEDNTSIKNLDNKQEIFKFIEDCYGIHIDPSAEIQQKLEPNLIFTGSGRIENKRDNFLSRGDIVYYDFRDMSKPNMFKSQTDDVLEKVDSIRYDIIFEEETCSKYYSTQYCIPSTFNNEIYTFKRPGEFIGKIGENYFLINKDRLEAYYLKNLSHEEFAEIQRQSDLKKENMQKDIELGD